MRFRSLIAAQQQGDPMGCFQNPRRGFLGWRSANSTRHAAAFFLAAKLGSSCSASRITNERLSAFREGGKLSRGMAAAMHFLQLADVDLGIDRGGFELFVTKQLLDVTDVRAAFEHVSGARVT